MAGERKDSAPAMAAQAVDRRILELLIARLCHELSGPIAAINNGIEILAEEDPNFFGDAVALVGDSAHRARQRLQFYRFAYGFSLGSATAGPAPHELALGFFARTSIGCDYPEEIRALSADWQKLACNLLPVGADALLRGGRVRLSGRPPTLEAVGEGAALSREVRAALLLMTPIAELTARTVHAYFTGLLAKTLDCSLIAVAEPGRIRLSATANRG
jgi:histidine phosphotransferase ChpT